MKVRCGITQNNEKRNPICSKCRWFRSNGNLIGGRCGADGFKDVKESHNTIKCQMSYSEHEDYKGEKE